MRFIIWLCIAMLAAMQGPAMAQQANSPTAVTPKPLPQSLNTLPEAKQSATDCATFTKEKKSRQEILTACLASLKYSGGSSYSRERVYAALCLDSEIVLDGERCYDAALEAWADFDPARKFTLRRAEEQRIIDVVLPKLCDSGHGRSCLLLGQMILSKTKDDNRASEVIDCSWRFSDESKKRCQREQRIDAEFKRSEPKYDPVPVMTAEQGLGYLKKACQLKVKSACGMVEWEIFTSKDPTLWLEQKGRPNVPQVSIADYYGERCSTEKHRASCYFMSQLAQDARIYDAPKWTQAACDAGDGDACGDVAVAAAQYGDIAAVEPALIKACTLDSSECGTLKDWYNTRPLPVHLARDSDPDKKREFVLVERVTNKLRADRRSISGFRPMMRVPEEAARSSAALETPALDKLKDKPIDWNVVREALPMLRKRTLAQGIRTPNRTMAFLMCDLGEESACGAAGIRVPSTTPEFVPPARDAFIAKVMAEAKDRCGVKKEVDYCYDMALVMRPDFPGAKPEELPQSARFGAAACMGDRFDMCAFSGLAFIQGQMGGPPDRRNGGALLNKGCSGNDAKSCYFFAILLTEDGKKDQAKLAAQKAIEINPSFAEAKELLAKLN